MKKFIVLLMVTIISLSATSIGCAKKLNIDESKTQLYVWNFDGGVGHTWLDSVITRFESEKEEADYYREGKIGVEIIVMNSKDSPLKTLKNSSYSVFFLEGVAYNTLAAEKKLLNISDIVANNIEGENGNIEGKLSSNTAKSLKAYDGNYYVLPHYQSFDGVYYNKTLFDEKKFYFAKNPEEYRSSDPEDPGYGFILNNSAIKTCGPNGVYEDGQGDDGLPSTMEEYERLCNFMVASGVKPFIWLNGANASYQMKLVNALWASLEGYEGTMANYTMSSGTTKTKIVKEFDEFNQPISDEVVISESNFYDIYQQESRYYVLDFCKKVFSNSNYFHSDSLTSTFSQTDIHETFLESKFTSTPVGMILEGSYWENEARDSEALARVIKNHPDAATMEIGIMPLPVKVKGTVAEGEGRAPVVFDMLSSYAFINANVKMKHGEAVERLAKDFLKFCYTDISLSEFTEKSSVPKDLNYQLTSTAKNNMSYCANTVWNAKANGKVVVPISDNMVFIKNPSVFSMYSDSMLWKTTAGVGYSRPWGGFRDGNLSAMNYFLGMKKDSTWWNNLSK